MARTRRKFDEDFKAGAVRIVRETGKPIAQVARDLGINEGTLGNWVNADKRLAELPYPILSDITKQISRGYGVLIEEEGVALRGTFLIDPEGVLRWTSVNDLGTGRSVDEMLRTIDALQTGAMCPCNWKKGEPTIPT